LINIFLRLFSYLSYIFQLKYSFPIDILRRILRIEIYRNSTFSISLNSLNIEKWVRDHNYHWSFWFVHEFMENGLIDIYNFDQMNNILTPRLQYLFNSNPFLCEKDFFEFFHLLNREKKKFHKVILLISRKM
jgi:hypothetical protein